MKKQRTLIQFPDSQPDRELYFGCGRLPRVGHYVWLPHFRAITHNDPHRLWLERNDGNLQPQDTDEREGSAALVHWGHFTTLAWWDRSVDQRPGSNSVVLVPGLLGLHDVLQRFAELWPEASVRQNRPIEPVPWTISEEVTCPDSSSRRRVSSRALGR